MAPWQHYNVQIKMMEFKVLMLYKSIIHDALASMYYLCLETDYALESVQSNFSNNDHIRRYI